LSPVNDVRVETHASIAIAHDRNGAPCDSRCDAAIEMSADRFAERHAVARDGARRQRPLLSAGRQIRIKLRSSHGIVRKAARCEYDTTSRAYRRNAIEGLHNSAPDRSVLA